MRRRTLIAIGLGSMPPYRGRPDDIQADLNLALQRQLGLKLERRKAPLELLVVESGDPNPIAN